VRQTISQASHALERRLDLPLFHRITRKIAPTEAGEVHRRIGAGPKGLPQRLHVPVRQRNVMIDNSNFSRSEARPS
jgi:hypothetical protein